MYGSNSMKRLHGGRATLPDWLVTLALALLAFIVLFLTLHPRLGPYYVPWSDFKRTREAGVFGAAAWIDRAIVVVYVALFLTRLVRISGTYNMSPGQRRLAMGVHSTLLGVFVFALWLPGRGDLADIIFLAALGGLAVLLSGVVLALTRFKRRYLAEDCLATVLLLLGIAALVFFVAVLGMQLD